MESITLSAPAKINLFLEVTGKRPDGYHEIQSLMFPVSLADRITVSKTAQEGIRVECTPSVTVKPEDNIAYRAAELFCSEFALPRKLTITIDKKIPAAAGLAGGSTDAAAVLTALDRLYRTELGQERLCALAVRLGADVPFCIARRPMQTAGIGEIFTPIPSLPRCTLVIAKDGEGVSTARAYADLDRRPTNGVRDHKPLIRALAAGDLAAIGAYAFNCFESVILPIRPMAKALKDFFAKTGADFAMMSGSGPSVFAVFSDPIAANAAHKQLAQRGVSAYICEPLA